MRNLFKEIEECKTMTELDRLRNDIMAVGREYGQDAFEPLQKTFIKQKNKIKRKYYY